MTRRTIPQLRKRLLEIADGLDSAPETAAELRQIVTEMVRSSPTRKRAPDRHPPLSQAQRLDIRRYAERNPDAHLTDIAIRFNTNPGRVSEALRGHQ